MEVIVTFTRGENRRGRLLSFNTNNPVFYLQVPDGEGKIVSSSVPFNTVQQIIYLKKGLRDDSQVRQEKIEDTVLASATSFRLNVEFNDGSVLTGTAHKYNPGDMGFYLSPLSPADKSERIFVLAHAVKRVEVTKLFGRVLLDQGKISEKQLEIGMLRQREARGKKLGSILLEENMISEERLRLSLKKQEEVRIRIGEILLGANYITAEQLDYALRVQQKHRNIRLGQVLVELKFLTPNDICIALATQFNCAWVDLADEIISPETARSLPREIVKRFEVIPVEKRKDSVLVVATAEPQNPDIIRGIAEAAPCRVELAVAYEVYILRDIARFFPDE